MSSGKEKIPKLSTLTDKDGEVCSPVLREAIDLCTFVSHPYKEGEFLWSEIISDILVMLEEAVSFSKNGQRIKELLEEYKAPIESRLDILDL